MGVKVALIGGFLGAGKTTTLVNFAKRLKEQGEKVIVITNDQGNDLIDTQTMKVNGVSATEVTGGCFCCKFDDLHNVIDQVIREYCPTWILAEAVGSCTDLVATVHRPLKKFFGDRVDVAPVTIVVDPERADLVLENRDPFPWEVGYLYRQQIQEADIVLINKSDCVSSSILEQVEQKLKLLNTKAIYIQTSALLGKGIVQWQESLESLNSTGTVWLESIDYDVYATAEAHLGWLNASFQLSRKNPFHLKELIETIGFQLNHELAKNNLEIAHAKLMGLDLVEDQFIKGNKTSQTIDWQWEVKQEKETTRGMVFVNFRILANPDTLSNFVKQGVRLVCEQEDINYEILRVDSFSPSRPVPTYREVEWNNVT